MIGNLDIDKNVLKLIFSGLRSNNGSTVSEKCTARTDIFTNQCNALTSSGSDDNLSSTQNHSVHLRKLDQETWQEQAKNSAVMEGFDSIMNSASGPSSAALYLISAVKAALESKVFHNYYL